MRGASAWVLSATASGVRLLITKVSASAPAARKARALSYSQLLPGNTGMITRGRAILAPPYTWISLGAEVDGLDLGGLAGAAVGEDALDTALPGLLELGELDDLGAGVDDIALDGGAQGLDDNAVGDLGQLGILGELDDKATVERGEEVSTSTSSASSIPIWLPTHILKRLSAPQP